MPLRLHGGLYGVLHFRTSAAMPSLVRKAANKTGRVSSTDYLQQVVAKAVAKDLGVPLAAVLEALPPVRSKTPPFIADGTRHTHGSTKLPDLP